jgi:hypothetical protein
MGGLDKLPLYWLAFPFLSNGPGMETLCIENSIYRRLKLALLPGNDLKGNPAVGRFRFLHNDLNIAY